MSSPVKDREISAEQEYVDQAYVRLDEMRDDAQNMMKEGYRQALAGTKASLVDRDAMVYQASLRAQALDIADDGLVFGRLDLVGGDRRYVGRIGVRTREHESMVIDWRAPAAEAFYRATPEDPHEVIRRRVLHSRGHTVMDIEDDLLSPEAADGLVVVGDGAFLASLARTREGSMRDIVATIQREQDEVIRAPADGTVIVRGGPGTGKTAVALHRVAYLLFHHRRRFGTRGVLIVGPNRRFTAYIERVLPSLGEGSAVLRSLGEMADGVSASVHDPAHLLRLKGAASMARVLRQAVTDHPPGAPDQLTVVYSGTVVRLDRQRLDQVRRAVHQRVRGSVNRSRARAAEALLDALWERFTEVGGLTDAPASRKSDFVSSAREQGTFEQFLAAWWPLRMPIDVLASLSDARRLQRAAGGDLSRHEVDALAYDWSHLAGAEPASAGPVTYQDVALLDEIDSLLGPLPRAPRRLAEDDEDPYILDGTNILTGESSDRWEPGIRELTTSIERSERSRRVDDGVHEEPKDYGHIVVDEAQDLSPMQWRMLGRRGRNATWTVVEDPAQSAWEDLAASRDAMSEALGLAAGSTSSANRRSGRGRDPRRRGGAAGSGQTRRTRPNHQFELTTNYRNSTEIAAVATRVLARAVPSALPARAVRVSGNDPEIRLLPPGDPAAPDLRTAELSAAARDAVIDLLGHVEGTIGVIVPLGLSLSRPTEAGVSRTSTGNSAGNATTQRDEWEDLPERVQVLNVLEAKGLEFDAAVIVAPEEVAAESPTGLRTLYVAVSRATQRLTVLTADPAWHQILLR
jgi:DNA helicase IV